LSAAVSALLVGEAADLDSRAIEALLARIGDRPATVTIAGVAARLPLITNWAPVTGQITIRQMKEMSVARALKVARESTALIPTHIPVRHRAVPCWTDAMRLAPEYDVVAVAGRPRRYGTASKET
jgi:hypothetical protein